MRLEKANELHVLQALMGGGYNRNATRQILPEARKGHKQQVVNQLISKIELDRIFGFTAATEYKT